MKSLEKSKTDLVSSLSDILSNDNQLLSLSDFRAMLPTREQMVGEYLANLNIDDQLDASEVAKQLQAERPMAHTVALIPVAAQQEAPNVFRALSQYAKQKTDRPPSVILLLNAPESADDDDISYTIDEIELAKRSYPQLDVRYSDVVENDHLTIGGLRKRLWDAALVLGIHEGMYSDPTAEIIGLNHDIDTIKMSSSYVQRVQRHFDAEQNKFTQLDLPSEPLHPASTIVKHAYDPSRPNISNVVSWFDYSNRQARRLGAYEASLTIPMTHYAQRGGFKSRDITHETIRLTSRLAPARILGALVETSPRRFADRLAEHTIEKVWTDDSFGSSDNCRVNPMLSDISQERKDELIFESLDASMGRIVVGVSEVVNSSALPEIKADSDEQKLRVIQTATETYLMERKRLATTVLKRFIKSPLNAEIFDESFDIQHEAEKLAQQVINGSSYVFK